jgi:hypothetical protein
MIQYKYGKGDGNMTKKLTNTEFLKRLNVCNPDAMPLEEYKGYNTKIKVTFKSCGHVDFKAPSKLYRGQRCGQRDCYNKRISEARLTNSSKWNVEKLKENGIVLIEEYKGRKRKSKVKNLECGHEYDVNIGNALSGSGCPLCHGFKDTKRFAEEVKSRYNDQYKVIGEYVNNRTKIEVIHNECGHRWKVIPKDLLNDERCPNCILSKGERYIKKYLESKNIEFEQQYKFNECRDINPLPFDFAVMMDGNLSLIEFDGSQHFRDSSGYWGGRCSFEGIKHRDGIKNRFCHENNIPLLRIPYWWIKNGRAKKEIDLFVCNRGESN